MLSVFLMNKDVYIYLFFVQMYPDLDVRNIVESNGKEEISNWCDFGVSYCEHKFTVRPFHCLGEQMALCLHVHLYIILSIC